MQRENGCFWKSNHAGPKGHSLLWFPPRQQGRLLTNPENPTKNHRLHSLKRAPLQESFVAQPRTSQEWAERSASLEHRRHFSWKMSPHGPECVTLHYLSVYTGTTRHMLHHLIRPRSSDGKPGMPNHSRTDYLEGRKAARHQLRMREHHLAREGVHLNP